MRRDNAEIESLIRNALLADEPGPMPQRLRSLIYSVPNEAASTRSGSRRFSWRVPSILATAALLGVVAVLGASSLLLTRNSAGPAANVSTSPVPAYPVADYAWHELHWSAPQQSDLCTFDNVQYWHDQLVADGASCDDPTQAVILHSYDGTTWTRLDADPSIFAHWHISDFVAGANGLYADGVSYTNPDEPTWWRAGGQGAATAAATQTQSAMWTSSDGVHWMRDTDPNHLPVGAIRLTAGAAGFLGIGATSDDRPVMWFSPTGSNWLPVSLDESVFGNGTSFADVRATDLGFVVVGNDGSGPAAWLSTDGLTWVEERMSPPASGQSDVLAAVRVGSQGLLALDGRGGCWASSDGRSWRLLTGDGRLGDVPLAGVGDVLDNGRQIVSVDESTNAAWVSLDGVNWNSLTMGGGAAGAPTGAPSFVVQDGLVYFVPGATDKNHPAVYYSTFWSVTVVR